MDAIVELREKSTKIGPKLDTGKLTSIPSFHFTTITQFGSSHPALAQHEKHDFKSVRAHKLDDPTFHPNSVGGKRCSVFPDWMTPIVANYIIEFFTAYPKTKLNGLAQELSLMFSRDVSRDVYLFYV
jgi:hypothetical protein